MSDNTEAQDDYGPWKLVPMQERSYDMRTQAILAFNKTEGDLDDKLQAAWVAMVEHAPAPPSAALAQQAATPPSAAEDMLHTAICEAVGISNIAVELVRTEAGRKMRDILRKALVDYADARQAATPAPAEPPLLGRWHHGEGYLCSGSLRIARADFDTNPTEEFRDKVLDWMVETLNAELRRYAAPPATPAAGGPF